MVFWIEISRGVIGIIVILMTIVTVEFNPSPLNEFPDKLPGVDLETDNNDILAETPDIYQSYAEFIHEATTNSIFIPEGINSRSAGVATLVDETPLGVGDPVDVPQECV